MGRCAPYKIANSGESIIFQALHFQNIDVCSKDTGGQDSGITESNLFIT